VLVGKKNNNNNREAGAEASHAITNKNNKYTQGLSTTHIFSPAATVRHQHQQWHRNEFESGGTCPARSARFCCGAPFTFLLYKYK